MTLWEGEDWKLKDKAPDSNRWRTRFGRGCGLAVRETKKLTNS